MIKNITKLIAGFLVPGLTHILTGKVWQGLTFFACISASFSIGLITDLDYYYRYDNQVKSQYIFTKDDQKALGLFKRPNQMYLIQHESYKQPHFIQANGIGKIHIDTSKENASSYSITPTNYAYVQPANTIVKVGSIGSEDLGILDTLKKLFYSYLRPVFTSSFLYKIGKPMQLKYRTLLDSIHIKNIPSPVKDLGFVFVIMACLFNVLVLIHGGEVCYNSYKKGNI